MKRYLTVLRWQTRFALARYGRRVSERITYLAVTATWDKDTAFARFVDRLSPFEPYRGYKRLLLRRGLYRLRYPGHFLRLTSLSLTEKIVYRLVERPSLGRYEGSYSMPDVALKIEWLDNNSEWAEDTTGDSDWSLWTAMFSLVPPWSTTVENWLLHVDSHGFVYGHQFDDWPSMRARFVDLEGEWSDAINDGEAELDIEEPEGWREGQPEFNGAFDV